MTHIKWTGPDKNVDEFLAGWQEDARELGRDAGRVVGSWTADGNTRPDHAQKVLALLEEGDPEAYDFLPDPPTLSGEFRDNRTPKKLFEDVTGFAVADLDGDAAALIMDALADAWEEGRDEAFEPAAAAALHAALPVGVFTRTTELNEVAAHMESEYGPMVEFADNIGEDLPDEVLDEAMRKVNAAIGSERSGVFKGHPERERAGDILVYLAELGRTYPNRRFGSGEDTWKVYIAEAREAE